MDLVKLECPYCGAELSIKSGTHECFCTYCGKKLLINDDVQRSEVTAHINYKDMARLKELEMKEREIAKQEEQERLQAQAVANYYYRLRKRFISWAVFGAIISFLAGIRSAFNLFSDYKNIESLENLILTLLFFAIAIIIMIAGASNDADISSNKSVVSIAVLAALPTFLVKYLTAYIVKLIFF